VKLKQINYDRREGWNGTFNGQQMPATDYWYTIQLEDGRSKGILLKRWYIILVIYFLRMLFQIDSS
jgi:gliding motility-associated-like protein